MNSDLLKDISSVLYESAEPKLDYYKPQPTPELALAAAKKHAEENGPIEFDGMNCNNYLEDGEPECLGWDGESRRCYCDNRRVDWDIEKNKDGTYYAVARAY